MRLLNQNPKKIKKNLYSVWSIVPSRMSHFGKLPDVVGGYLTKCQKSPYLGAKSTNLVTLGGTRFQCYQMTALPDMNIFFL